MDRSTSRSLWIGLGLIALVLLVASSWGGGMMFGRGLAAPFGPFGYRPFIAPWLFGVWGFGLLVRLLFFGLIAFLVVRLFRGGRGYRRGYDDGLTRTYDYPQQAPEEILRRRYAAGEISREQYEEMRRTLEPVA
jgi:putative membrane protein